MRSIFKKILSVSFLLMLAACASEGEESPSPSVNIGTGSNGGNTAYPVPVVGAATPSPVDTNSADPTPPSGPAAPPSGNNPNTGNNPNNGGNPSPWGRGLDVQVNTDLIGNRLDDLEVTVATPVSSFRSFDETLPLTEIFNVTPLSTTLHGGQTTITFDPLANIDPLTNGASMRFVKSSPIVAPLQNSLEVNFNVIFPKRFRYNHQTRYWESIYLINWVRFSLLACNARGSCREILSNISAQPGSIPCDGQNPHCELNYHQTVQGSQISGGGVEYNDSYVISVEGTSEADSLDENGFARLCSNSLRDCTYSHPYCVAGVCSAVRGGRYFQVDTPADLRATGRP